MWFSLGNKILPAIVINGVRVGKTKKEQKSPFINWHTGKTWQRLSTTVLTHLRKGSCVQFPDSKAMQIEAVLCWYSLYILGTDSTNYLDSLSSCPPRISLGLCFHQPVLDLSIWLLIPLLAQGSKDKAWHKSNIFKRFSLSKFVFFFPYEALLYGRIPYGCRLTNSL